jgi:hypothetical protein
VSSPGRTVPSPSPKASARYLNFIQKGKEGQDKGDTRLTKEKKNMVENMSSTSRWPQPLGEEKTEGERESKENGEGGQRNEERSRGESFFLSCVVPTSAIRSSLNQSPDLVLSRSTVTLPGAYFLQREKAFVAR